jgi:hypothetical protein
METVEAVVNMAVGLMGESADSLAAAGIAVMAAGRRVVASCIARVSARK